MSKELREGHAQQPSIGQGAERLPIIYEVLAYHIPSGHAYLHTSACAHTGTHTDIEIHTNVVFPLFNYQIINLSQLCC